VYREQDRRLKLKRQSWYRDIINATDGVGVKTLEMSSFSDFSGRSNAKRGRGTRSRPRLMALNSKCNPDRKIGGDFFCGRRGRDPMANSARWELIPATKAGKRR
jgi:hypothetical protein